jgi:hypothetical protein
LGGDVVSVCLHPVMLLFSLFALFFSVIAWWKTGFESLFHSSQNPTRSERFQIL